MTEYTKDDLKELKETADELGIKYSPNISYELLESRIKEKKEVMDTDTPIKEKSSKMSTVDVKKKASKLVRCMVTCKNPNKKEWTGEFISAGNSKIGFFKKFVLFNEPYHIPQIIVNYLKEKQYQRIWTKKVDGREIIKNKNVPEFDVQILDNLTEKELEDLKQRQLAKGIIDDD